MDLPLNFSGSFCPQVQNIRGQSTKLKGQEIDITFSMKIIARDTIIIMSLLTSFI